MCEAVRGMCGVAREAVCEAVCEAVQGCVR